VSAAAPLSPPPERGAWLLACLLCATGLAVLVAVLAGVVGRTASVPPPPVLVSVQAPVPSPQASAAALAGTRSGLAGAGAGAGAPAASASSAARVARRWLEGFYAIYASAQRTFGVNWLLLASIHAQETAFSTAPGTYHGLNFAHCCGGPMQFNVTNRPVTTWSLVAASYRYARRPSSYNHRTATHPSIYDDFDAIMAAAHLLSVDGASEPLDGAAWAAAYDYYGHGVEGVVYADQVLARAIAWSHDHFCISCSTPAGLVQAVHAAYGQPVLEGLERAAATPRRPARAARRPPGR